MAKPDLLIVGGTARAAAWCAVRAGLRVAALDRFNDLDLRAVADPVFLWDGSDGQVERVVGALGVPWMYTGPLENKPALIDRCAALAPLRGNPGDVLRAVRDPLRLAEVLREWVASPANEDGNVCVLDVRPSSDPPQFAPRDWQTNPRVWMGDGESAPWLIKPLASCGGYRIDVWEAHSARQLDWFGPHYFQRIRSSGRPCFPGSVSAEATPAGVRWFGSCATGPAQLLGLEPPTFRNELLCGPGFTGPWVVPLLEHLAARFGLTGPFGVDLMAYSGPRDRWAVIEVNPRLGASMDLFEDAHGPFGTASAGPAAVRPGTRRCRRTVFAAGDVRVGHLPVFGPFDRGWVADVPAPGSFIPDRYPICTVYADDAGPSLDEREAEVRDTLTPQVSRDRRERSGANAPVGRG